MENMCNLRIGTGYDVHPLKEGRKLVIGGVQIPYEKGLDGHSDGDVLTHAIMDALLGAAALPDIGNLFPDDYSEYKDILSLVLLERVMDLIADKGYEIVNVDSTVICQAPKLSPYIDDITNSLAKTMNIEPPQINVKATTTEHLGFTGRGEGIAVEAVCLIIKKEK